MARATIVAIFCCALVLAAAGEASAQNFDISSGGLPTITGALDGSVTGSAEVGQSLAVIVNFGELSPVNASNIVKVVVPIAIQSTGPYQVAVSVSGGFAGNLLAVQSSDIGFGVNNLRRFGESTQNCSNNFFRAPFDNDPATTVTLNANGRAAYPSSLANIVGSAVILSGPRLSKGNINNKDRGYIFDAIFAIKPQFYASGIFNTVITFTISAGPNVTCN